MHQLHFVVFYYAGFQPIVEDCSVFDLIVCVSRIIMTASNILATLPTHRGRLSLCHRGSDLSTSVCARVRVWLFWGPDLAPTR